MKNYFMVREELIKKKPFLQSALAQGIINLTSLSRIVKPEIESEVWQGYFACANCNGFNAFR